MEGDLEVDRREPLRLRYGFAILDRDPDVDEVEAWYAGYARP